MTQGRKIFNRILLVILIVYGISAMALIIFQRDFLYFPAPSTHPNLPSIHVETQGEKLNITVLNEGKPNALLYFGGNGESVDNAAGDFANTFKDYTVYLVDYRGYGRSSGKPTEEALNHDALLLYDHLKAHHTAISLIGRSLGSGVATYLASQRPIAKLILVTPFDSIEAVAYEKFPIFPIRWMLWDTYDSLSRVPSIHVPTLILIAKRDTLIPTKHSLALYNAFRPSNVEAKVFPAFGHNDIQLSQEYYPTMESFLARDTTKPRNKTITVNLDELNEHLTEIDIFERYEGLSCYDESSIMGDRCCYADINQFNGVDAKVIAFFFKNDHLSQMLVQLNSHKSYHSLVDDATRLYGTAKKTQKSLPQDTQLIEWQVHHGKWVTSMESDPLQKETFLWLSSSTSPSNTKQAIAQKSSFLLLLLGTIITLIAWYSNVWWKTHFHHKHHSSPWLLYIVKIYLIPAFLSVILVIGVVLFWIGLIIRLVI